MEFRMPGEMRAAPGGARISRLLGYACAAALVCALAGCGGGETYHGGSYAGSGNYSPPGPPEDPWGPYIREASARFRVPEKWIREVMRQESGGHQYLNGRLTTSASGAMGLMQVMPATYDGLRQRYALGSDPYDPHDNIMAGSAYIREMYDQFGYPEFLAAYNAGPGRVSSYLAGGGSLPAETVNYVASIAPRIADAPGPSEPSPVYAENRPAEPQSLPPAPVVQAPSIMTVAMAAPVPAPGGCDPNAAYDPAAPCSASAAPAPVRATAPAVIAMEPIVDAADAPGYVPPAPAEPVMAPRYAPPLHPMRLPLPPRPAPRFQLVALGPTQGTFGGGGWSVQVGAFASPATARAAAQSARAAATDLLGAAHIALPAKQMVGGVLYRARLTGLSAASAVRACARLEARRLDCVPVGPGQVW
jgi:D-alanyl-D-alanine carboxypeptidase